MADRKGRLGKLLETPGAMARPGLAIQACVSKTGYRTCVAFILHATSPAYDPVAKGYSGTSVREGQ